jgi:hypothetical protein
MLVYSVWASVCGAPLSVSRFDQAEVIGLFLPSRLGCLERSIYAPVRREVSRRELRPAIRLLIRLSLSEMFHPQPRILRVLACVPNSLGIHNKDANSPCRRQAVAVFLRSSNART